MGWVPHCLMTFFLQFVSQVTGLVYKPARPWRGLRSFDFTLCFPRPWGGLSGLGPKSLRPHAVFLWLAPLCGHAGPSLRLGLCHFLVPHVFDVRPSGGSCFALEVFIETFFRHLPNKCEP